MISLVKKENLNVGILQSDFDVYKEIIDTFSDEGLKKGCLIDIDNSVIPEYFKGKIAVAIKTNKMLVGYAIFMFENINNVSQAKICDLHVESTFKDKGMEVLLTETIIYIAAEVGTRSVVVNVNNSDSILYNFYRSLGFYEIGISDSYKVLSINVSSSVMTKKLYDKFRDIPSDYIDYKKLKLVKKISEGTSSNIYLTDDGKILKMFTTTSFTNIKDKEETLKTLKEMDINEIVKPKNLVYYDGVFVGYIMDYLPSGKNLWSEKESFSFEEKIDKIKQIESALKKLHKKGIYVCDLDPNNIFFDNEGNVKFVNCDSFVTKNNVINEDVSEKYKDPNNKLVSKKTDTYAFAISILELLTNIRINNDTKFSEVEKIYNKNKNKLPVSFNEYFEHIFKDNERFYLSDSYEKYMNEMYSEEEEKEVLDNKSGKVSIIILSVLMVITAVLGYLVLKNLK